MNNGAKIDADPLVLSFREGNKKAFESFYNEYYWIIFKHALRWLSDPHDAEDITADSFVKLWLNRERFNKRGDIIGFLHITTRNASFDFLKRVNLFNKKQEEIITQQKDDEKNAKDAFEIWDAFSGLLLTELSKMPTRMREIFLLSFEQGLKPAEIARQLNISVQTVSNQKYAAINLLKSSLKEDDLIILLSIIMLSF